jgi:hypothetical protein
MGARDTPRIKQGIHWDLPEARDLWLALAASVHREAVVGHTMIKSVRPERIGIRVGDGNGRCGGGIVQEPGLGKLLERVNGVIEIGCAEATDIFHRDAGERVEGNEIPVDFCSRRGADVCHPVMWDKVL